jgi:hypothetical protein
MNERIRELATDCAGQVEWDFPKDPESFTFNRTELEKFAKLIVEECAGIYCKIDNGNLHIGTDDYLEALHKTFRS